MRFVPPCVNPEVFFTDTRLYKTTGAPAHVQTPRTRRPLCQHRSARTTNTANSTSLIFSTCSCTTNTANSTSLICSTRKSDGSSSVADADHVHFQNKTTAK